MKLAQNKRIEDFSSFKNDEQQSTLVKNRKIHSNRSQFDNFQSQVLANILVDFVDNIKQKYNYISPIDYLTMFNDNRKPTFEEYVSKYMEIQIDALQHISVEQYLNVVISQQHISDISLMNTAQQKSYDRLSIFRKLVTTNENRLSNNDVQQQSNKEETRSISSSLSSSPSTASSVRTQPSIKTSNLPEDNTYELLLQQCSKRFQCRVKKKPVTFSTIDQLHYCTKPYQEKPVNAWMGWDVMLFFKEKNLLDMALLFLNADGNELIEVFNSCETNGLKMYDYLNEELQNNYFTTLSIIEYHRFVSELRKYIQLLPLRPVVKNAKTCTIF
ncbi:unnamed protein product [Didymodactylos carnosus]|nr:unnamed protein product [Didymodactylos carnosus]CAF3614607.1 unnamed protein product [Didymodactylos carnosus]